MNSPSTHGDNGRGSDGRFGPGNTLGRGNPLAGQAARLRAALFDAVSEADLRAVVAALIAKAKGGDVRAVAELLDRTIGRPTEADLLARLEALEAAAGLEAAGRGLAERGGA